MPQGVKVQVLSSVPKDFDKSRPARAVFFRPNVLKTKKEVWLKLCNKSDASLSKI